MYVYIFIVDGPWPFKLWKHLAVSTKHRLPVPRFLQLLETSIQFAGFGSFSRKKVLEFALRLGWSRWWSLFVGVPSPIASMGLGIFTYINP